MQLKDYYTIREAAAIAGVTVQSIYSKIDKAEKETGRVFCSVGDDKIKRVSAVFLAEYYGITGNEEEDARKLDIVARLEDELERERERHEKEIQRLHFEIDRLHGELDKLMQMNMNNQILLLQSKPEHAPAPDKEEAAAINPEPEQVGKGGILSFFRRNKT